MLVILPLARLLGGKELLWNLLVYLMSPISIPTLLGNEAGRIIYDGETIIAANGTLLTYADRLTFKDVSMATALVDIQALRLKQAQASTAFNITRPNYLIIHNFDYPVTKFTVSKNEEQLWEKSPYVKEEEFTRVLALGLFDLYA